MKNYQIAIALALFSILIAIPAISEEADVSSTEVLSSPGAEVKEAPMNVADSGCKANSSEAPVSESNRVLGSAPLSTQGGQDEALNAATADPSSCGPLGCPAPGRCRITCHFCYTSSNCPLFNGLPQSCEGQCL